MFRYFVLLLFLLPLSCSSEFELADSPTEFALAKNGDPVRLTKYSYGRKSVEELFQTRNGRILFRGPEGILEIDRDNLTDFLATPLHFRMHNLQHLNDEILMSGTSASPGMAFYSVIDLKYAYGSNAYCADAFAYSDNSIVCRRKHLKDIYIYEYGVGDNGVERWRKKASEWMPHGPYMPDRGFAGAKVKEGFVVALAEESEYYLSANEIWHFVPTEKAKLEHKKIHSFDRFEEVETMLALPDGRIVFSLVPILPEYKSKSDMYGLWILNAKNPEKPLLPLALGLNSKPVLTNKGQLLFEKEVESGAREIWLLKDIKIGAQLIQITSEQGASHPISYRQPVITDDGKLYVLADRTRKGYFDLWVSDISTIVNNL